MRFRGLRRTTRNSCPLFPIRGRQRKTACKPGMPDCHSDVIKAQIQYQQQEAAFTEANLGMEDARLDLSVLIFPTLDENFAAVDDLDTPRPLPTFGEAQELAGKINPDLRVATETLR